MRAPIRRAPSSGFKRCLYNAIDNNGLVIIAAAVIVLGIVIAEVLGGRFNSENLNIVSALFEVAALGFLGGLALVLKPVLLNRLEDDVKLTGDYDALIDYYLPQGMSAEEACFVVFDNSSSEEQNLKMLQRRHRELARGRTSCGTIEQTVFPIVAEHVFDGLPVSEISVHDTQRSYELPAVVQSYYWDILAAHQTSRLYNQPAIRVADWGSADGGFEVTVERCNYLDSMVTNRAMDFSFGRVTVRDLIAFGPVISPLGSSELSNHLGINALLITSDRHIPLVKRRSDPSIGKRCYSVGVNAMLERRLALSQASGVVDSKGIHRAVIWAIEKELKVHEEEFEEPPVILAAYRDLLEGGKPQFLVLVRTSMDKETLSRRFSELVWRGRYEAPSAGNEILEDGESLAWVNADDLEKSAIAPSALYCAGRRYPMLPYASASVAMVLNSGVLNRPVKPDSESGQQ